jgi:hypothetical protein
MKTIYVNGDSFPAGAELADHLLPGYPGLSTMQNFSFNQQWGDKKYKEIDKLQGGPVYFHSIEKQLAWPGVLNSVYGVNVINGSMSGASITGIAFRTCVDLLEIYSKGCSVDNVFIQLTSLERIEIFKNTPDNRYFDDLPIVTILSTPSTELEKNLATAYAAYNDDQLLAKFLYGLILLEQSVKNITGKLPIYLSTGLSSYITDMIREKIKTSPPLKRLTDLTNFNAIDVNNKPMLNIQVENNYLLCPQGHYEQRTHTKYAEEIFNGYLK